MNFTIECPICKNNFRVNSKELAEKEFSFKCRACGTTPSPDIMTAYRNVGKTMADLYEHQNCEDEEELTK
ncbi:MAG: hypothetical protein H6Q68_3576 [Firmicutes bacterium]|nr:hypothetical protein [Bacillota bacterium]